MKADIFEDLFVLEMANNHLGKLQRGLAIVDKFSKIIRFNNVRAAIKIQLRDVNTLIHADYRQRSDIRYIKKTLQTALSTDDYTTLITTIRKAGVLPCATPFDESSVDLCVTLGVQIIKLASSDLNDWFLIEKIAKTRKPVIASTGGSSLKDIDDLVTFFQNRNIPLALNHCVSLYPTEDSDLEMNQIDFLRNRYPHVAVGFSSHEYHSWDASIYIAYAKGARTFERHIDIEDDGVKISPYCSTPAQIDTWFKAFRKAKEMSGGGTGNQAHSACGRNQISGCVGARHLRQTRPACRDASFRRRSLPGHSASQGPDLLSRIDAGRSAFACGEKGRAGVYR